jgi:hypothetical protein
MATQWVIGGSPRTGILIIGSLQTAHGSPREQHRATIPPIYILPRRARRLRRIHDASATSRWWQDEFKPCTNYPVYPDPARSEINVSTA